MSQREMDELKFKVANNNYVDKENRVITNEDYNFVLESKKHEAMEQLHFKNKIDEFGWRNIATKETGKIGGHTGGNMVKELIKAAEEQLSGEPDGNNTSVEATENQA